MVGFALETGDGPRRALGKLERKNMDYVVLNDASAPNAERSSVLVLGRNAPTTFSGPQWLTCAVGVTKVVPRWSISRASCLVSV